MVLRRFTVDVGTAIGKIMQLELQSLYLVTMTCLLITKAHSQESQESAELNANDQQQQQQQSTQQPFPVYQSPFNFNSQRLANTFFVSRIPSTNRRYSSLYEAEGHLGRQALHLLLSNNRLLPWSCSCDMFWRDLGEDFHPRFIRDGRCGQSTCYHGHYACTPLKYNVPVLKRITPVDEIHPDERIFDSDFYFVSVQVTASCYCGRITDNS